MSNRATHIGAGLLTFAALGCSGSALAQYYDYGGGGYRPPPYNVPSQDPYWFGNNPQQVPVARPLKPGAIVERLEDQGYDDIGRPRFTGGTYMVDATAPGGLRVRLAVDAVQGVILNTVVLARVRPGDEDDDDRMSPREYRDARRDYPDSVVPNGRPLPSREPDRSVSREPAVPPVTSRELPPPSDTHLAPTGDTRATAREARRTEPRVETPRAEPSPQPYGVNPTVRAAEPRPAARQAARPATPPQSVPSTKPAESPAPVVAQPKAAPQAATAEVEPKRNVRVIQGVTPINPAPDGQAAAPKTGTDGPKDPKS